MDRLVNAFARVTQYLKQHTASGMAIWRDGLSTEGIQTSVRVLPFCLPQDVVRLYQWGDGLREAVRDSMVFALRCELFSPDNLLPLGNAVQTYSSWMANAREWAAEDDDDDPDDIWHPQWFPLARTDKTFHVVWCASSPQTTAPVYYVSRAEDYTVELAYDSVTCMFETLAACCDAGVYGLAPNGIGTLMSGVRRKFVGN